MSGWGAGGWGSSGWGTGSTVSLSLASALAVSTRQVLVRTTAEPRHASDAGVGDATNPATWSVVRLDTGAAFTVALVEEVDPTAWRLTLVEALGSHLVKHEASAPGLVASDGSPIVPPRTVEFLGIGTAASTSPEASAAARRLTPSDVANPPIPHSPSGTLVVTSGGDYAEVSGDELLKKLILRRLTTRRGAFFHLPDYGASLAVKQVLPGSLVQIQADVERQVALEPEVKTATAKVSVSAGVLTVAIRARTKAGSQLAVQVGG